MLQSSDDGTNSIAALNILGKTISTFASDVVPPFTDATRFLEVIADQGRGQYLTATGEYVWTVNGQPNTTPGEVSVRWIITKLMSLAGYTPDDLIFEGFGPPDGGGGGPGPVGDPLASLNFLTEVYTVHGATVTAADVIDKPARVGASGLEILDNDPDGSVLAIGDFLADLITADWTIVIEWEELTSADDTELIYICESVDHHHIAIDRTGPGDIEGYASGSGVRLIANTGPFFTGVHKVAMTRKNAKVSMSTDGSSAATDTSSQTINPMEVVSFGGPADGSFNRTFIRTVTLYPPQDDDAVLPGLSA
jgi:hypothetical protein